MRLPDAVHHVRTDSLSTGHRSHTPMGGIARLGLNSGLYNCRDPFSRKLFAPPGAGLVAQKPSTPAVRNRLRHNVIVGRLTLSSLASRWSALPSLAPRTMRARNAIFLRHIPCLCQPHRSRTATGYLLRSIFLRVSIKKMREKRIILWTLRRSCYKQELVELGGWVCLLLPVEQSLGSSRLLAHKCPRSAAGF
jgi:hypothetical protein